MYKLDINMYYDLLNKINELDSLSLTGHGMRGEVVDWCLPVMVRGE